MKLTVHLQSTPYAVYQGERLSLQPQLEQARQVIQENYPAFVDEVGRKWNLEGEPLWAHLPFTEMSTLRSPLITELWHRVAARELARDLKAEEIHWSREGAGSGSRSLVMQRLRWLLRTLYWHFQGRGRALPKRERPTFLCTFAPNFFEGEGEGDRDLLYGGFFEELSRRGKEPVYLVNLRGGWGQNRLPSRELVVVEAQLSPGKILGLFLKVGPELRLLRKVQSARVPLFFQGLAVTELVRDELVRDLGLQESLDTRLLEEAVARVKSRYPQARCFCFGFENQPRERAILTGKGGTPAVGVEPSLFTRSHLPWWADRDHWNELDALLVYGPHSRRHFAPRLGHQKLVQTGPLRYTRLLEQRPLNLPRDQILVATPIARELAENLLEVALEALREAPHLELAVRFHPHQPLPERAGLRVVRERLYEEMQRSVAVIFCSSRIGVEALAMGAVPVVYAPSGQWEVHSLTDFPEAACWCRSPEELSQTLVDLVGQPQRFEPLKAHWPRVLDQLMSPRDERVAERAVSALEERGLL